MSKRLATIVATLAVTALMGAPASAETLSGSFVTGSGQGTGGCITAPMCAAFLASSCTVKVVDDGVDYSIRDVGHLNGRVGTMRWSRTATTNLQALTVQFWSANCAITGSVKVTTPSAAVGVPGGTKWMTVTATQINALITWSYSL